MEGMEEAIKLLDAADAQLRATIDEIAKSPKLTQPEILNYLLEARRLLQEAVTKLLATR